MKQLLLAGIVLLLCACNSYQNPIMISLDKIKQDGLINIDGQLKPASFEFVLIENPPEVIDSLYQLVRKYSEARINKEAVEKKYDRYFIQFFAKTERTEGYIDGSGNFLDTHNDIMQERPDYLGEYRFERCTTDTLKGQWTMEVKGIGREIRTELTEGCN